MQIKKSFIVILFNILFGFNALSQDWLIDNSSYKSQIQIQGSVIELSNGLISRKLQVSPNLSSISLKNLKTQQELIRAVGPEAIITIDGHEYFIGGLYGQKQKAYLEEEIIPSLTANPNDFQYESYTINELKIPIDWQAKNWTFNNKYPQGKQINLVLSSNLDHLKGIKINLIYQVFDGLPLISKQVTVTNNSTRKIKINQLVNEVLFLAEEESSVVGNYSNILPPQMIFVENNFAFNNAMNYTISNQGSHWSTDSTYTSQVNYALKTPVVLKVYPSKGIGTSLEPGESLKSIISNELLFDSYDRERRGLAKRKMYQTIAPWTNQNPIFMHLVSTDPVKVKEIIDQCKATGYEMVILSFGSGLNMEDDSPENILKFKMLADYAHSQDVKLGGYSLFSSRTISPETDVIDPITLEPNKGAFFGHAPCLASEWGINYLKKLENFLTKTGFDLLEHDGPYPGDVCASTKHIGHEGLEDSQWKQMKLQKEFYQTLASKGIYINAPDWYFLDGTNKIGLGYREVNFSLPRNEQKILNRQNIFDGTWDKTSTMSWGFVPLTKYHGGGEEAVLEPLSEHLPDYEQLMEQYYGAGVQACYRGPRLFDTNETKDLVIKVLDWYKNNREILSSSLIHLRRADGRDWDGILHVNPNLETCAYLMLYNPLETAITRQISVPLYYSGITKKAQLTFEDNKVVNYDLDREYAINLEVTIPAKGNSKISIRNLDKKE